MTAPLVFVRGVSPLREELELAGVECVPWPTGKGRKQVGARLADGRDVLVVATGDEATRAERLAAELNDILRPAEQYVRLLVRNSVAGRVTGAALVASLWDEAQPPPTGNAARLVTVRLSDVAASDVAWIWPGRIARGKLTLLYGLGGLGKSWVTHDLAARISRGDPLPGGGRHGPATVLLASAEDDAADTLRPRLESAGADLERVHVLTGVRDGARERTFRLTDLDALEAECARTDGLALLVVDPVNAYLGAGVDSHRDADVRALLAPLIALAARRRIGVVAVSHMGKARGVDAQQRAIGSVAYVNAARCAFVVLRDPEAPDRRLLLPAKNNLAPMDGLGLAFRIAGAPPRIEWLGQEDRRADEILRAAEEEGLDGAPRRQQTDRARELILDLLAEGAVLETRRIRAAADARGISWRTVERTKDALGVVARRVGRGWGWALPGDSAQDRQGRQGPETGALGGLGPGTAPAGPGRPPRRQLALVDGGLDEGAWDA